jgi:hypothetical protein
LLLHQKASLTLDIANEEDIEGLQVQQILAAYIEEQ